MVNSLYLLSLKTLVWTLLPPSLNGPSPRYFHSAQAWGDNLVVFGGQSFVTASEEETAAAEGAGAGHLETLDELWIYSTKEERWSSPVVSVRSGITRPSPRYAHLSIVSTISIPSHPGFSSNSTSPSLSSRLVILGGQDYQNEYLPDLAVLDLETMEWVAMAPYPRKAGGYRSVAATASVSVRPKEERAGMDGEVVHSSYTTAVTEEEAEPVVVFSNTNFSKCVSSPFLLVILPRSSWFPALLPVLIVHLSCQSSARS
jgi:hypothetical protein